MKFTNSHEWVEMKENGLATVGISHHAQKELGEIVYVELPEQGKSVSAGKEAAVLESTKAAADVYSPVSGTIENVNQTLTTSPELVNQSPEDDGWLFEIRVSDPSEFDKLMSKEEYLGHLGA